MGEELAQMIVTGLTQIYSPKPLCGVGISAGEVFDSCKRNEWAPSIRCNDIPVNRNSPCKFDNFFRSLKQMSMYEEYAGSETTLQLLPEFDNIREWHPRREVEAYCF